MSPTSWSVGNWSLCSRTCGGGTQSRPVQCTRRAHYREEPISGSLCPQPAPSSRQDCNSQSCPPAWSTGPWTEVTRVGLRRGGGWIKHYGSFPAFSVRFAHLLSCSVLTDLWEGVAEESSGLQEYQPLSQSPAAARHRLHFRAQAEDPGSVPAQALPQAQEAAVAGVRLVSGMAIGSPQNGISLFSPSCLLCFCLLYIQCVFSHCPSSASSALSPLPLSVMASDHLLPWHPC